MQHPNSSRRKTIGLFGCYWIRNYGDDLMGLIFAKAFSEVGFDVCSYGMKGYEGAFGLRTVQTIDELAEKSDYLVLGGGGFMVPRTVRRGAAYHEQMENASLRLAKLSRDLGVPFYALSIGGAGEGVRPDQLPPGWRALLASAQAITVRNQADIPLAKEFCPNVAHFPDVVWLAPTIARPQPKQPEAERAVLVHTPRIEFTDLRGFLRWLRRRPLWKAREWKLKRAISGVNTTSIGSLVPRGQGGNLTENILTLLDELRACRAIVSPALHLGVTALAFGNAFLSWHGPAKTKVFMQEVGVDGFCGPDPLTVAQKLTVLDQQPDQILPGHDRIAELQTGARQHIQHFLELIGHLQAPLTAPGSVPPPVGKSSKPIVSESPGDQA